MSFIGAVTTAFTKWATDQINTLVADNAKRMLVIAAKSASSTVVDFSPADGSGIPSWANRVTVNLYKVSTNGTSVLIAQLGTSAGIVNTGYDGIVDSQNTGGGITASITAGLGLIRSGGAAAVNQLTGKIVFERLSGNIWVASFSGGVTGGTVMVSWAVTNVTLPGALDRVRITTLNGTDTFDNGQISITVEG